MVNKSYLHLWRIAMIAMLSAVGTVLMFFTIKLPFMPSFLSLDFSDFPALLASFSLGPLSGVAVCFFKNLIHLFFTSTAGVGELSNFLLGTLFVLPAGLIYRRHKGRGSALLASLVGALAMAAGGVLTNYFIVYPLYGQIGMPTEAILGMYQTILPSIQNLWQALLVFNLPFTFGKGLCSVLLTFLIYKKISPILRGKAA